MIMDELLEFADGESVIAAAGTTVLGDTIDLGTTVQDFGNGKPMYLVLQVDEEVDSAGDGASLELALASDAVDPILTDGSASQHFTTGAIAEANLTAGTTLAIIPLPLGTGVLAVYERYLGILATVSGEAITAGSISAFLTVDPSGNRAYPDANN